MSANFGHLQQLSPELHRLGTLAERFFSEDANTSLIKSRQFGEYMVKEIAALSGVHDAAARETTHDLLRRLSTQQVLPREFTDIFHAVRKSGNEAIFAKALRGERETAPKARRGRKRQDIHRTARLTHRYHWRMCMVPASRATYRQWVVNALSALGAAEPTAVYGWIRANEAVPSADLFGSTSDGESLFEKKVRFARWDLSREGIVRNPRRGIWSLNGVSLSN